MTDKAIIIEGISKQYRLGAAQKRYDTLQAALIASLKAPFKRLQAVIREGSAFLSDEKFWALSDINLEIDKGEVVGLIGRNGAGKSTLLKVLSRITKPTAGQAIISGRLGSLLEVGTGFHPELTGRENVYLSGAILGMKRHEITRKFDEIVAFSEVEKFIDTQVKHYSSGMYLRLAFAVAAHLETEILLVDEVLAVGDTQFQKKCLGKMGDVANEGRTVVFVSHNMGAIQRLCSRTVWIDGGQIRMDDMTDLTIESYLSVETSGSVNTKPGEVNVLQRKDRTGTGEAQIAAIRLLNNTGYPSNFFVRNNPFTIEINVVGETGERLAFGGTIVSQLGIPIVHFESYDTPELNVNRIDGSIFIVVTFPQLPLVPGRYWLNLGIALYKQRHSVDYVERIIFFDILDDPNSTRPFEIRQNNAHVILNNHWELMDAAGN